MNEIINNLYNKSKRIQDYLREEIKLHQGKVDFSGPEVIKVS